jgi:hypothetical protein
MKRSDFLRIPLTALAVMIANIAVSFVVVFVYSTFVSPGSPPRDYEAFAMSAAPVSSIVAGVPLMFLAAYWLARGRSPHGALAAAGAMAFVYIALDILLMFAAAPAGDMWAWEAVSYSTKLLAALGGARLRSGSSG